MNYKDAVAEGRRLVKRSEQDQWRLAELTWEQVQAGNTRNQWGRDIGISGRYAATLYNMWERWGTVNFSSRPPFTEAYKIATGLAEQIEKYGSEHAAKTRAAIRNMTPSEKAEVTEELLEEPEARRAAGRALDKHYDRDREQRERETPTKPVSQYDASIELLVRLRAISAAIKNATDLIMSTPRFGDTDDLAAVVDRQIHALSVMRDVLIGRPGMDDELAKILNEA